MTRNMTLQKLRYLKTSVTDEKGSFTILSVFGFVFAVFLLAFLVDLGMMFYAGHVAQSIADAAAIAGAQAVNVRAEYDENGNPIRTRPTIDETVAERFAQTTINMNVEAKGLNGGRIRYVGSEKKKLNDLKYFVEVRLEYAPVLLKVFMPDKEKWSHVPIIRNAVGEVREETMEVS